MSNFLVSIICPSYNCARFICDAIKCVINQTYSNWELLIVDDCSTDNTYTTIQPFFKDRRIRYFYNPKNSGAAVSRNWALREARGKWIAFLDSDDLWAPDKLKKQICFMEENGYHFSYTGYREMDENGKEKGVKISGPKKVTKIGMFAFCWPGCLTVMYNADVVGLVQTKDIKKNNDYAMWLVICKIAECFFLDEDLAWYRRGRTGSISNHSIKTMIKWHYKLFHDAEKMNTINSVWHTCVNLMCGLYKKIRYEKKYELCG